MADVGDTAPEFTAPLVDGDDIGPFNLSDALGDGPVVLAFFPGAFTGPCTEELCAFQDQLTGFADVGATVYGVSVDTPFALQEFADQEGLEFGLISDTNKEIIDAYHVRMDFEDYGYYGVAKRSVFVIDADGEITYAWITDDPGVLPDYDAVEQAAADAA